MKKFLLLFIFLGFIGCKSEEKPIDKNEEFTYEESPVERGRQIFEGKGNCTACHKPDQKVIGPSIAEIAKIYRGKEGEIAKFLNEESPAIVEPHNYPAMQINLSVTKRMKNEERAALEAYILSH